MNLTGPDRFPAQTIIYRSGRKGACLQIRCQFADHTLLATVFPTSTVDVNDHGQACIFLPIFWKEEIEGLAWVIGARVGQITEGLNALR